MINGMYRKSIIIPIDNLIGIVIQRIIVTADRKIRIILLYECGLCSKKIRKIKTGSNKNKKFNNNVSNNERLPF